MKKILKLALAFCAVATSWSVLAQDDVPELKKETVIIDQFTYTNAVNSAARDNIRAAALSGMVSRGRFVVVDALTSDKLAALYANRNYEDDVNDANWQAESQAAFKELGAQKLIQGQANNLSFSSETKDGKTTHKAQITFSLKVYNIMDGSLIGSKDIQSTGSSGKSKDAAFDSAVSSINTQMRTFVDEYFKFETAIIEMGEADKKGRIKSVYIAGGSEMGVSTGTIFNVYGERTIGGRTTRQEIGKIVAKEVMEGVTKCNVTKGDDVIKTKFNDKEKMVVVSAGERLFAGLGDMFK